MFGLTSLVSTAVLFTAGVSAAPAPQWNSGYQAPSAYGVNAAASSQYASSAAAGWYPAQSASSWSAAQSADSMMSDATVMSQATDVMSDTMLATQTAAATVMSESSAVWSSPVWSSSSIWSSAAAYSAAPVMSDSSVAAYSAATAAPYVASSSWSASASAVTQYYGSGSSNTQDYNNCVQQCVAQFGSPSLTTAPPSQTSESTSTSYNSSSGSGTTYTVIVAPTQGVLRFVPFTVNANPGDTIEYVWHANNHTVTKSSQLEICNKTSDSPFASGEQNEGFTFTQVVNDTNPVFYYCGTPTHCEKGMFGIINPPSVENNANTSVASMMTSMAQNSSSIASMSSYTSQATANNSGAANWGSTIDMSSMPEWSNSYVLENVMYTRTFLAANPQTLNSDGSVNLSGDESSLSVPADITDAVSSSNSSASASSSALGSTSTSSTNGAVSKTASGAVVGVAALAAVFLAL